MAVTIDGTTGISGVDGSAGTPAVKGSDTNTGIFFPAADTIAFGEGGAEAMRITSAGNLQLTSATSTIVNSSGTPILQQTGSVLQVVQATTSTQVTVAGATYADTGLSATITPTSANSKILVMVSQGASASRGGTSVYTGIRLRRDATTIFSIAADQTAGASPADMGFGATGSSTTTAFIYGRIAVNYVDSPATTAATTYSTQGAGSSATTTASFQTIGTGANQASSIILMEIAG